MVFSAVSWCCMVWICLGIAWNCWDSQSRSSTVQSTVITGTQEAPVCGGFISLLVRFAQGMDGLLKVAGMMTSLVMKWIIPKNPLRLAPVSYCGGFFSNAQYVDHRTFNMFDRRSIIQSDVFFFQQASLFLLNPNEWWQHHWFWRLNSQCLVLQTNISDNPAPLVVGCACPKLRWPKSCGTLRSVFAVQPARDSNLYSLGQPCAELWPQILCP